MQSVKFCLCIVVFAASDWISLVVLGDNSLITDNSTFPGYENETIIISCRTNETEPVLNFVRQHDHLNLDTDSTPNSIKNSSRYEQVVIPVYRENDINCPVFRHTSVTFIPAFPNDELLLGQVT